MSFMGVASIVEGALTVGGSLFGNEKDQLRKEESDRLFAMAQNGDANALIKLRCLAGDDSVRALACSTGAHTDACGGKCGYATEASRNYARTLLAGLSVGNTVGAAGATVAAGAASVGYNASPSAFTSTAGALMKDFLPGVPAWLVIVGVGSVAYIFLRKK